MLGIFRSWYEKNTLWIGRLFARTGIGPNGFTILSLLASMISCYFFYEGDLFWGLIFIPVLGIFDMLDGSVARSTGKITRFGGVLDHTIDRYAEFFIILGLGLGGFLDWRIAMFSLFGMLMASFVRGKAESIGGLKSCTVGIAERQEKMALIILGIIGEYFFVNSINAALLIVGLLSHITVVQRLMYTKRKSSD